MIQFLMDYQGEHTGPHFFRNGQKVDFLTPGEEQALILAGRAIEVMPILKPLGGKAPPSGERVDWTVVNRIGRATDTSLHDAGIHTVDDLLGILFEEDGLSRLIALPNVDAKRVRVLTEWAKQEG